MHTADVNNTLLRRARGFVRQVDVPGGVPAGAADLRHLTRARGFVRQVDVPAGSRQARPISGI